MIIKAFDVSQHMGIMCEWLKEHKCPLPSLLEMPAIGFVAVEEDTAVAMGFLRRVEGGFAQLDGLVSNPSSPGEYRHWGIDAVVEKIIITAKQQELKALISFSSDKSTLARSIKHGFVEASDTKLIVCTL